LFFNDFAPKQTLVGKKMQASP